MSERKESVTDFCYALKLPPSALAQGEQMKNKKDKTSSDYF